METKGKTTLVAQKEAFRLWFEYLKIARQSSKSLSEEFMLDCIAS